MAVIFDYICTRCNYEERDKRFATYEEMKRFDKKSNSCPGCNEGELERKIPALNIGDQNTRSYSTLSGKLIREQKIAMIHFTCRHLNSCVLEIFRRQISDDPARN